MATKVIPPYPRYPNFCLFGIIIAVVIAISTFLILLIKDKDENKGEEEEFKKKKITPAALILLISILCAIVLAGGCGVYYKSRVTEWIWNYGTTAQKTEYLGAQALNTVFQGMSLLANTKQ
ncbi:hypothetical protein CPAV1605_929 [seawater metagenome]|uniref:Uncharacterized protein n=1 Tax=seawater metagenome TaxID=1561972 RepID=A0A5E8CKI0_9ZZZZ